MKEEKRKRILRVGCLILAANFASFTTKRSWVPPPTGSGSSAAGSAVKYRSGAMPVLSRLQRPLPVASSFLTGLGLRSSTTTCARGALCAAASPAASPAAPPPRMRMFGILTPAFLSRISEAVLISRVLCL